MPEPPAPPMTRRSILCAGLLAVPSLRAPDLLIVDTHAHAYSPDETTYPPIPDPRRPPGGKASLDDLRGACQANNVRAVCVIQTSGFYGFDNRYVCDLSKANPDWVAGVCTLDPGDPEGPAVLRRFVRDFSIRGLRTVATAGAGLDHRGVEGLWRAALDLGLTVNVNVRPGHAARLGSLLGAFPKLPVVLDHCMAPAPGPDLEPTLAAVVRLARFPNLYAKVSFVPNECTAGFPCAQLHEACLKIVSAFGAERCLWGSHFPNHLFTPHVTYAEHLRIFLEALPLSDRQRRHILGQTANRLYFRGRLRPRIL